MTPQQEKALRSYVEWLVHNDKSPEAVGEIVAFVKMSNEDKITTLRAYVIKARTRWDSEKASNAARAAAVDAEFQELGDLGGT